MASNDIEETIATRTRSKLPMNQQDLGSLVLQLTPPGEAKHNDRLEHYDDESVSGACASPLAYRPNQLDDMEKAVNEMEEELKRIKERALRGKMKSIKDEIKYYSDMESSISGGQHSEVSRQQPNQSCRVSTAYRNHPAEKPTYQSYTSYEERANSGQPLPQPQRYYPIPNSSQPVPQTQQPYY